MRTFAKLAAIAIALVSGHAALASDSERPAWEPERVVWKGAYTAPYQIAAECLVRKMATAFDRAAMMRDNSSTLRVRFWRTKARGSEPVAHFLIQPAGDDRVEIGWRRADMPDAVRLDEAARSAAIECGGRSA